MSRSFADRMGFVIQPVESGPSTGIAELRSRPRGFNQLHMHSHRGMYQAIGEVTVEVDFGRIWQPPRPVLVTWTVYEDGTLPRKSTVDFVQLFAQRVASWLSEAARRDTISRCFSNGFSAPPQFTLPAPPEWTHNNGPSQSTSSPSATQPQDSHAVETVWQPARDFGTLGSNELYGWARNPMGSETIVITASAWRRLVSALPLNGPRPKTPNDSDLSFGDSLSRPSRTSPLRHPPPDVDDENLLNLHTVTGEPKEPGGPKRTPSTHEAAAPRGASSSTCDPD